MGKRLIKELSCEMTAREKAGKSDQLAAAVGTKQELEDEKKAYNDDWKERNVANDRRILKLAREVRTGHEVRNVECEEQPRYADRMVDIVRLDTGEVAFSRPMERGEMQKSLGLEPDEEDAGEDTPSTGRH